MKQEIITYLAGPRNFIQGVELYEKYGINRMLKKSFRRQGETETMKAILLEELRKIRQVPAANHRCILPTF